MDSNYKKTKNSDSVEELCSIIASYELDEEDIATLIDCINASSSEEDSCCGNKTKTFLKPYLNLYTKIRKKIEISK